MDVGQLATSTGCTMARAVTWLAPIADAMHEFEINTPKREAAFLAQVGYESQYLQRTSELWGPTPAQLRYEGRADLGNLQPGDGYKFRGRGLIEITGRANYAAVSAALGIDFVNDPDALLEPEMAATSAAWWWKNHGCNELADAGDFPQITKTINGGMTGYSGRFALWQAAQKALEFLA